MVVEGCEAVGRMVGEAVRVGKAVYVAFAISANIKERACVGVLMLSKLNAGDEVAVHATTPIIMQINARINTKYNGLLRAGADDLLMALKWGSVSAVRFHSS